MESYDLRYKKRNNNNSINDIHLRAFINISLNNTNKSNIYIYIRTALFWVVAQRVVVIYYRRFGTTYRSHLQGSGRWDR